jgi:predicted component of type VI protein secretion system
MESPISMLKRLSTNSEPLAGELIVRNGPDRGISRSLLVPITLVGSAEACDLRILDETVRSVHCAVSVTPDGPHLRSVGGLTPVNGIPSSGRLLQTGDVVLVGPVELEVHWRLPPSPTPNSAAAVHRAKPANDEADQPLICPEPPTRAAYHRVAG